MLSCINKITYSILINILLQTYLFVYVSIIIALSACKHRNTGKPVHYTVTKFKPPVVKTFLGRNENGATVTVDEANQLINLPLKIIDDKNNTYTIHLTSSCIRKRSVIENEQTGKKEIAFTTVADLFKATPLPKVWQKQY